MHYVKIIGCHGKAISTVRAGNVIGGGDWGKNRIIPDCIKALMQDEIKCIGRFEEWDYLWSDDSLLSGKRAAEAAKKKLE